MRIPLQPFTEDGRNGLYVECFVQRSRGCLSLDFSINGEINKLVIPGRVNPAVRKDNLWCTTCFESFFGRRESTRYWELNVSPDGCWNLYRFTNYRTGMTEEMSVSEVASKLILERGSLSLSCSLPIDSLILTNEKMVMGIACVLESRSGEKNYWAITHPDKKPDFHNPKSMSLSLS